MKILIADNEYIVVKPVLNERYNMKWLSETEKNFMKNISSQQRRNEWSSWRRIVKEELSDDILIDYDITGSPILHPATKNKGISEHDKINFISVSHSNKFAAVMFSEKRCGIDIETTDRNFVHITPKYISEKEKTLNTCDDKLFNAVIWCAKEAAYKYLTEKQIDFINDLTVTEIDLKKGSLSMRFHGIPLPLLNFTEYESHIICWLS